MKVFDIFLNGWWCRLGCRTSEKSHNAGREWYGTEFGEMSVPPVVRQCQDLTTDSEKDGSESVPHFHSLLATFGPAKAAALSYRSLADRVSAPVRVRNTQA